MVLAIVVLLPKENALAYVGVHDHDTDVSGFWMGLEHESFSGRNLIANGDYYLKTSIWVKGIYVPEDTEAYICLNGHTLNFEEDTVTSDINGTAKQCPIFLEDNARLTISDCKGGGQIVFRSPKNYGIVPINDSIIKIEKCTINTDGPSLMDNSRANGYFSNVTINYVNTDYKYLFHGYECNYIFENVTFKGNGEDALNGRYLSVFGGKVNFAGNINWDKEVHDADFSNTCKYNIVANTKFNRMVSLADFDSSMDDGVPRIISGDNNQVDLSEYFCPNRIGVTIDKNPATGEYYAITPCITAQPTADKLEVKTGSSKVAYQWYFGVKDKHQLTASDVDSTLVMADKNCDSNNVFSAVKLQHGPAFDSKLRGAGKNYRILGYRITQEPNRFVVEIQGSKEVTDPGIAFMFEEYGEVAYEFKKDETKSNIYYADNVPIGEYILFSDKDIKVKVYVEQNYLDRKIEGETFSSFKSNLAGTIGCMVTFSPNMPNAYTIISNMVEVPGYTVTFESNCSKKIEPVKFRKNTAAKEPNMPYINGARLVGWYTDAACRKKYDFKTKLTGNIKLYALWKADSAQKDANAVNMGLGFNAKQSGKKLSLTWGRLDGVDGYDVLADHFSTKKLKKVAASVPQPLSGNTVSLELSKFGKTKLNAKKDYTVCIKAYVMLNGKKTYVGNTNEMHIAGSKSAYTNAKSLKVKKSAISVKKKKSATIKYSITYEKKSKKALPSNRGNKVRFFSTNSNIAKVDSKGKITGKKKGTCDVYVITLNGIMKKVKVTVK